jgi:hypothetical protein
MKIRMKATTGARANKAHVAHRYPSRWINMALRLPLRSPRTMTGSIFQVRRSSPVSKIGPEKPFRFDTDRPTEPHARPQHGRESP